jgi:hypothetical protein
MSLQSLDQLIVVKADQDVNIHPIFNPYVPGYLVCQRTDLGAENSDRNAGITSRTNRCRSSPQDSE